MKVALTGRGEEAPWLRSRRNSRRSGNGRARGWGLFEAGRAVDQQKGPMMSWGLAYKKEASSEKKNGGRRTAWNA